MNAPVEVVMPPCPHPQGCPVAVDRFQQLATALLETVFHNASSTAGANVIAHRDLHGRLHAQVLPPRELLLIDLRDSELARLGVQRSQLTTSPAEHYPCTRTVAQAMHGYDGAVDGIVWHSRQAEQQGFGQVEAAVVFCDRVGSSRASWALARSQDALGSLREGAGLAAVKAIAVDLGLTLTGDEF
ncbi:MAG: RES domain-containing protein [Microthrixaceae bacterium]|nr:RES domain-containing protein [Microthrixaceae bacterium]